MNPKFITLDGTEGSGKSTQINLLREWFAEQGVDVWFTREPGGTPLGERLRELLLDPETEACSDSELLLIMAARCEHITREIKPRLARGQWVVSDRFNDATYAYQGWARGIDRSRIAALENWMQGDFQPDLRIILGLDSAGSRARLAGRNDYRDRFEQERHAFFDAVSEGYRVRAEVGNALWIDANVSPQAVFAQIKQAIEAL
ncbi:dTMP kinase [Suttonella sp. R2A3]|uniref:dTMP kinase n=1 Tax=Suttonella sp. R2A3 TaxID=2908648 RepID=UPI001F298CB4|nr:dTMP kinase [Suttonella sp. R2A3]UJF24096.1 dTMP kinase [Suttonella sp. R2A3]